ncbi:MAG: NUDIX domain-containing protein [Candidatus Bathyarchaeota archaeon]|nr:NUDIX domain-containing protein [Candidatus Bathyarchaeota archaeon]
MVGVGILIRKGGEYLMIKRASEPDRGLWSIPGGMVEIGEKAAEAAVREAEEETGLEVEILEDLGVVDKIVRDEAGRVKYHFVIIDYLAEPVSGEMHHHDDALDALWVHPRDFRKYQMSQTVIDLLKRINLYPEF